ncbi:hypothetical protein CNR22_11435 [Sphingobacteriaceae bacterium]|nr:hypothetical protein CNR22_11435 [Sphingobacteriaceae bacterium]
MSSENKHIKELGHALEPFAVSTVLAGEIITFSKTSKKIKFILAGKDFDSEKYKEEVVIYEDQLKRSPEKIKALVLSKLQANKTIYARNCEVRKIDKETAVNFLENYHLMNSTQSGFNFGLFYLDELVAVASFSKGRKMNRLREDQRSFELIRFCCKSGITITGGLSKLIKNFCEEKKAGDVMTYVDKDLSDGTSFIRAGFKKHSETEATYFLVNRVTFERNMATKDELYDAKKFYRIKNSGNVKLVYTP